ncbi:MAG: phospho-N-acetylmuramoyl-pentapeptide-transferase [Coriobacteriales bacterium]|jgi:phospho-N-acetylmuramoyl-pentapeptide-transferase
MFSQLNQYPTLRVLLAIFVAAAIVMALMPAWIKLLHHNHIGQQVRADGPQRHLKKQGTPTMGGAIILLAIVVTSVLFVRMDLPLALCLFATILTGALGFLDDFESVSHGRSLGLRARDKIAGQALVSTAFCLLAVNVVGIEPTVTLGTATIDLGVLTTTIPVAGGIEIPWLYLVFVFLLMAGMSNAVNLNDGLDGLCGGCVAIAIGVMGMVAFSQGNLPMSVFAATCIGACIGFLWFNCYPAKIFMGDTGSLALGAAFAALAVLTKTEMVSLVIGGIFIVEALSVAIQVLVHHFTGKRVFLMAPLHHHFEKKGWEETTVVVRFWIIEAAFAAVGFALYFAGGYPAGMAAL